jgi:hypothetical protein
MLKRINSILLLSGLILFLVGCSSLKIPASYRYTPIQLKKDFTGNWTEVRLNSKDITGSESVLSGELIAVQSDTIYILTENGLKDVPLASMKETILYMFMDQSWKFALITGVLYLPDILAAMINAEAGFLVLGIPWILTGTIETMASGSNNQNLLIYPYKNQLTDLKKFARFPQGIPPGIDKSKLHLIQF